MTRLTLTVEEAAHALGVSRAAAYRCVKRGELPCVRLGRRIVVPVAAVAELVGSLSALVSDNALDRAADTSAHPAGA